MLSRNEMRVLSAAAVLMMGMLYLVHNIQVMRRELATFAFLIFYSIMLFLSYLGYLPLPE